MRRGAVVALVLIAGCSGGRSTPCVGADCAVDAGDAGIGAGMDAGADAGLRCDQCVAICPVSGARCDGYEWCVRCVPACLDVDAGASPTCGEASAYAYCPPLSDGGPSRSASCVPLPSPPTRCEDCVLTDMSCQGGYPVCLPHGFCDTCIPFCSAFGGTGPQAQCLYLAVTDLHPTAVCALPGPAEWMAVPDAGPPRCIPR